ncbi:MAG: phage tail protein [Clostridia bacterium]|nr:phage tail protein [Clostridia bacterium]
MSNKYSTIITTVGASIIAESLLNGKKLTITQAAAGDGGGAYYLPTVDQTTLKNEKWRGEIAAAGINVLNSNMFDVKVVVKDNIESFIIREIGLFDDEGNLIAVCNIPDIEKVSSSDGVSDKATVLMHVVVADSSTVTFTVNPSLDTISREEVETLIDAHNKADKPHPDKFAAAQHNHDDVYAKTNHNHNDVYAKAGHNHDSVYATTKLFNVTVSADAWLEDTINGGYYQTIAVDGILETDSPIADVLLGTDIDANKLCLDAWEYVTRITTSAGSITLWANMKVPVSTFDIQLKVVR